jgi:purine-nucleoside phosphorylase
MEIKPTEIPKLEKIHRFLTSHWGEFNPKISLICGSGWGEIVNALPSSQFLNYTDIPGMAGTAVKGHEGKLILANINDSQVLVFQGRHHFYEGIGWGQIRLPILLSHYLGIRNVILTNAAGGLSSHLKVGDIMVINDHINLMPDNPLRGEVPHPSIPRFPDQTQVYDPTLIKKVVEIGESQGISIHQGVYLALSGPAFETPAEIRAFAKLGADAVGMSTVPEAMIANALGMKVLALSCISNLAAGISEHKLSHEDVESAAKLALPKMNTLVHQFISEYN